MKRFIATSDSEHSRDTLSLSHYGFDKKKTNLKVYKQSKYKQGSVYGAEIILDKEQLLEIKEWIDSKLEQSK